MISVIRKKIWDLIPFKWKILAFKANVMWTKPQFLNNVIYDLGLKLIAIRSAIKKKKFTQIFGFDSELNIGYLDYEDKLIKLILDSYILRSRLDSCRKEPKTVKWIQDFFKENDVFYDIGANVGVYSFIAYMSTNRKCRVYSFEPSFSTFKNLCQNIYLNNFQDNIIPLNIALSDKSGVDEFKYTNLVSGFGYHMGVNKKNVHKRNQIFSQKIIKYSLDDIVDKMKLELPNHIKIDVDGLEFSILRGSEKILGYPSLKTIQVEVDFRFPESEREICDFLEKKGFKLIQKNQHGVSTIFDYVFKR